MSVLGISTTDLIVEVGGAPLDPIVFGMLVSAEVDTSLFLPDQFRLVFRGGRADVLGLGALDIAVPVTIQITAGEEPIPITEGEITAVEIDYGPQGNLTVVRGLDLSHRLMKGTKTRAFPDMTSSDAVGAVLAEAEVMPGEIIPTNSIYSQLTQGNVSDWVFIQQLAAEEGYDAYSSNGLFNFKPAGEAAEGLPPVMSYAEPAMASQLVMGKNLIRLRASVSGAEQVAAVQVRGWDPLLMAPVIGESPALATAVLSDDPAVEPDALAGEVGGEQFVATDRPYDSEGAAMKKATAIANQIASSSVEMHGECLGDPSIVAGASVSVGMAGPPFDGQYVVSEATHRWHPSQGGYTTWFTIGGRRDRSLLALSSSPTGSAGSVRPTIPGVVIATVLDTNDPEEMGRVKLQFPWLDDMYITDWVRPVQLGAGPDYGCLWIPEIETEVLVAFDRGDIAHPYVIGNLFNGMQRPIPPPNVEGGLVGQRRIMSRMRHQILFDDGPEVQGITIQSGEMDCTIKIDAEEQAISIISAGQVTVEAAAELSITAVGDISITTEGAMSIEASELSINAEAITVAADTALTLSGDAEVTVAGAVVMLGEG
ncbi:MAG TPA: VgrG-related protein [Acidimicrobiales bacterium]|nr:VgrG-related protein [Acidimicrobiales bacterium]